MGFFKNELTEVEKFINDINNKEQNIYNIKIQEEGNFVQIKSSLFTSQGDEEDGNNIHTSKRISPES